MGKNAILAVSLNLENPLKTTVVHQAKHVGPK